MKKLLAHLFGIGVRKPIFCPPSAAWRWSLTYQEWVPTLRPFSLQPSAFSLCQ